jgi:hypothetical protein
VKRRLSDRPGQLPDTGQPCPAMQGMQLLVEVSASTGWQVRPFDDCHVALALLLCGFVVSAGSGVTSSSASDTTPAPFEPGPAGAPGSQCDEEAGRNVLNDVHGETLPTRMARMDRSEQQGRYPPDRRREAPGRHVPGPHPSLTLQPNDWPGGVSRPLHSELLQCLQLLGGELVAPGTGV